MRTKQEQGEKKYTLLDYMPGICFLAFLAVSALILLGYAKVVSMEMSTIRLLGVVDVILVCFCAIFIIRSAIHQELDNQ